MSVSFKELKEELDKNIGNSTPKKKFPRNEFGLICDGSVNYVYNEDGTINWRKMINPLYLVPNKQVFERKGKSIPSSIEGLEDRELLILLGGIKELAQIRGFWEVCYDVISPSPDYVVAVCKILWVPNFETNNSGVTFSAIGDASALNTNSFGKMYLGPIAENRAFVRSVRNFLKINIVSQEEVNDVAATTTDDMSTGILRDIMTKYGITFEHLKKRLIEDKIKDADTFKSIEDIPRYQQFEIIDRIKTKVAALAVKS